MKSVILKNGAEFIIDKAKKEDAKDIIKYLNIIGGESENLLFGANGFPLSTEQEEEVIESKNSSLTSCLNDRKYRWGSSKRNFIDSTYERTHSSYM